MVVLAAVIRRALDLKAVITDAHFEVMAKIVLAASIIMGVSYASEWFSAWYGGKLADQRFLHFIFAGPYQPLYVGMLAFNVFVPQLLWAPQVRRSIPSLVMIALMVKPAGDFPA